MGRRRNKTRKPTAPVVPRAKPSTPPSVGQPISWRDHPLAVATLASIGTFTLTTLAFTQVVIPTQVAEINNKIHSLPNLEQTIASLRETNVKQLASIESLKRQAEELQNKNLFESGQPFPALLDKVRLNQPVSDVEKYFPNAKIDKTSETYWSVEFGYGLFSEATYYIDENSKGKKISHILYWLSRDKNLSQDFLQDRLVGVLGEPTKTPRKGFFEWHTKRYNVFKDNPNNYVVMASDSRLGYWPE